jgi:predicted nucleic acid-binding protein
VLDKVQNDAEAVVEGDVQPVAVIRQPEFRGRSIDPAGMGLVLDSRVAIAAERRGLAVEGLLELVRGIVGPTEIALSVVTVMELEHGAWRAKDEARANRRRQFLDDLIGNVPVYPISTELAARLAGSTPSSRKKV